MDMQDLEVVMRHPTKIWTLRRQRGLWLVQRRGIEVGSLVLHSSGYADWSFLVACAPSRSTLRRLLNEAADREAQCSP